MVEIIRILITVEEIFDRGTILKKNLKKTKYSLSYNKYQNHYNFKN